jgi:hypothetical protein
MHLDEIMKNYKPLYPDSGLWEDTFKMIDEDPVDSEIVQELLADLENNGEFREPVYLTTYEAYLEAAAQYKYAEGDTTDPYVPRVSNGTHRIYAHYLSKTKDVKVKFGWTPEIQEDYPILASKIVIHPDLSEESLYQLWDRLYSFKLNKDVWMTSELVSFNNNCFHILWVIGNKPVAQLVPYMEAINTKTLSITAKMGIDSTAKIGIINSEEEADDFFERKPVRT